MAEPTRPSQTTLSQAVASGGTGRPAPVSKIRASGRTMASATTFWGSAISSGRSARRPTNGSSMSGRVPIARRWKTAAPA